MSRQLYAMKDDGRKETRPIAISLGEAQGYNERRFGIFWSVNEFEGRRRIVNLKRIVSWFVEMDGDKDQQAKRLKDSPVRPSMVVESKNGYHAYFNAIDATLENYRVIEDGLVEYFSGDFKARDVTRYLRAPGYLHWKDEDDPFLVRLAYSTEAVYHERVMLHYFKPLLKEPTQPRVRPSTLHVDKLRVSGTLSEKLTALDHETALRILSGKPCVNGEVYDFTRGSGGNLNILVNGRSTSCFIDKQKMIGASPGGPTIWQWLQYFGHSERDIAVILKTELGL